MALKASKAKSGLFEVRGIEGFIESKVAEIRRAMKPAKKTAVKKAAVTTKSKAIAAPKGEINPLAELMSALGGHAKKSALIKAGKQKNQLLRSLIPLYLAKGKIEVSSGTTSKFWKHHKVTFAAPNAAKALREHEGFARRTAKGPQITASGVKYVEKALME